MSEIIPLENLNVEVLGPEVLSNEENIPGIFEIVQQEGIEYDISSLDSMITFDRVARLYWESNIIWSETFHEKVLHGLISYKEYLQDKAREFLRRLREEVEVTRSHVEKGHVVFSEIHCPKVSGCVAYHTQKTEHVTDAFYELTIAGFSGGNEKKVSIGTGMKIPAVEECLQLLKPVKVLIEECDSTYRGLFQRISILEIEEGFDARRIPAEQDQCLISPGEFEWNNNWTVASYPSRYNDRPVEIESLIKTGDQWSHSLKAGFGIFSGKLGVTIKALKTTKIAYELTGPMKYYGYHIPRTMGYYWTWENL